MPSSWSNSMIWIVIGNVLIAFALAASMGAGVVLFTIARQDDSGVGKTIGLLVSAVAIFIAVYVALGNHWL
jgi:hypothetical protein